MKKSPKYLLCAPALLALLAFSGCVSGKDSGSSLPYNPENAPAVVVSLPFSEYVQDTDEAFRARGIAEGMISQNALNAAMMDAKVKLAGKVISESLEQLKNVSSPIFSSLVAFSRFIDVRVVHPENAYAGMVLSAESFAIFTFTM